MLNPSTILLNDSSDANVEILNNSVQHFSQNPFDFSLNVFFECLSCLWVILLHPVFQLFPKKVVRGIHIRQTWGPAVITAARN